MDILEKLALRHDAPCITISLNTHRTHPDNQQDGILLKKLIREAELSLIENYGKRDSEALLEKLKAIPESLNMSFNLDSMHIFVSPSTSEVVKLAIPASDNYVHIGDGFSLKHLLKALNRTENYLILLLSAAGTWLYEAVNDQVVHEIKTHGFPFGENPNILTNAAQRSDAKRLDNQLREYLNDIDKALVAVHLDTGLNCVVVSVEENYHMLQQVADKPSVYLGHVDKHYKERQPHHIAADAFELMEQRMADERKAAVEEMKEAVSQSKVITDLSEIYRAAKEGRGEMLIARTGFKQAVRKTENNTLELVDEGEGEDIMSELALEVYGKKGRVVFADEDETEGLVPIALKLRY